MRVVAVLPARHGSTRLPGKPLLDIEGKSLIERAYENARLASSPEEVWVATDDQEIAERVLSIGGRVAMTPKELATGTDRIAWLAERAKGGDPRFTGLLADVYLNIQGDEPILEPSLMDGVAGLVSSGRFEMATASTPFTGAEEWRAPSAVKCLTDLEGSALFFTRAAVGFTRVAPPVTSDAWGEAPVRRHLGIYAYTASVLERISRLPQCPLELAESLEQLRALHHGIRIGVFASKTESFGVDTPEDLERMRGLWRSRRNTSS